MNSASDKRGERHSSKVPLWCCVARGRRSRCPQRAKPSPHLSCKRCRGFTWHSQPALGFLFSRPFPDVTMANRTDPTARSVHGTNPQNLVEKILRSKIYQNTYWKEQCFGLTGTAIFLSCCSQLVFSLVSTRL